MSINNIYNQLILCIYFIITDYLDDCGVPALEVRFKQEAKSDKQRKELIKSMNEGKIRVLFGSTNMLGAVLMRKKEPLPFII